MPRVLYIEALHPERGAEIMNTRTDYERYVLKEIRDLPESDLPKVLKMIHFLKEEIFQIESGAGRRQQPQL